jgi:hypothetical protein
VLIGFIITLADPLTSIEKIGPALLQSVPHRQSPILSSWFDGGRPAQHQSASASLSSDLPPVSREQGQQSHDRCQPGGRWSLFPGSRRMVTTTKSVSSLSPPPSACVVKTRASSNLLGITRAFAGPWPVVVAADGHLGDRYQSESRPVRCQVPMYHSVSPGCLLTRVTTFGPTVTHKQANIFVHLT